MLKGCLRDAWAPLWESQASSRCDGFMMSALAASFGGRRFNFGCERVVGLELLPVLGLVRGIGTREGTASPANLF